MDRVCSAAYTQRERYPWGWFFAILGPFVLLIGGLFFLARGEAFSLDRIRPRTHFSLQLGQPNSQKELDEMRLIVSQPFTYLTEGKDSYVFSSKDDKYVIKFFKTRRMTPKYWLNYIPFPWLDGKRLRKIRERERIRDEVFKSLTVSFEQYRYQTGLIFLHLFRTNYLNTKVCVKDKKGLTHYIPLDAVPFVVQQKTAMLFDYIDRLMAKGKEEKAILSLCHVLSLVKEGCCHGFIDFSDRIGDHYGFMGGRPIHVDGYLVQDESFKDPVLTLKEVFRISRLLELWVEEHHPILLKGFQAEVQDILTVLEE